jgi:uncharacterized protein (TIGR02599 family)
MRTFQIKTLAGRYGAFTLVEVLVSIGIMSIILLVLATMTAETQTIWTNTSSKIEQFRSARGGFDALTHRLSQATLESYMGYSDGTPGDTFYITTGFAPKTYARQSELRFLSGPSSTTMAGFSGFSTAANPTHSIFFVAPLGYASTTTSQTLTQLLNICGYYVQFGKDTSLPALLTAAVGYQPRYRYRLMELLEPTENNSIYDLIGDTSHSTKWITNALNVAPPPVHILAENIVALIILPQLGQDQKTGGGVGPVFNPYDLAPNYMYDSTTIGAAAAQNGGSDAGALNSSAQLPPVVQVTMVAIDEASAIRIQAQSGNSATPSNFGTNNLFQEASKYGPDLDQLEANLQQTPFTDGGTGAVYTPAVALPKKINYHVFTTTVSIKGAQWSTAQTN